MINTLFFSKFGTMNPERLITDVVAAKIIQANLFRICVRAEASEKWISYEASDTRTANQIVAKIAYLK